jgi:hypothetical protein
MTFDLRDHAGLSREQIIIAFAQILRDVDDIHNAEARMLAILGAVEKFEPEAYRRAVMRRNAEQQRKAIA